MIPATNCPIHIVLVFKEYHLDTGSATAAERSATSILGTPAHPAVLDVAFAHFTGEREASNEGLEVKTKQQMQAGRVSGSLSGTALILTWTFLTMKRSQPELSVVIVNATIQIAENMRRGSYEDELLNCKGVARAASEILRPPFWIAGTAGPLRQLKVKQLVPDIILAHLSMRRRKIEWPGRLLIKLARKSTRLEIHQGPTAGKGNLLPNHPLNPKPTTLQDLAREQERCEVLKCEKRLRLLDRHPQEGQSLGDRHPLPDLSLLTVGLRGPVSSNLC